MIEYLIGLILGLALGFAIGYIYGLTKSITDPDQLLDDGDMEEVMENAGELMEQMFGENEEEVKDTDD